MIIISPPKPKDNEKVVGIFRVKIFSDHIRVRTMYAHPQYTGKGVGTSLWNEMQELLPIYNPVIAYPTERTKSIDWYRKMGFAPTGEKSVAEEVMASEA